jgi:hypothetical protein
MLVQEELRQELEVIAKLQKAFCFHLSLCDKNSLA